MIFEFITLRITLQEIAPPIWRQFTVPADIRLDQLHKIIQTVMGWRDAHQHRFEAHGFRFSLPTEDGPEVQDERKTPLRTIAKKAGDRFTYVYDLGDYWKHDLLVDAMEDGPAVIQCLAGARACPPEDCGGAGGYEELLEALANPKNERHVELKKWVGKGFNPEQFSIMATNARLTRLQPSK